MVYLLKIVNIHGYVSYNQMVLYFIDCKANSYWSYKPTLLPWRPQIVSTKLASNIH